MLNGMNTSKPLSTCILTLALAAAALLCAGMARAQTVITSLPYTISASGTYVLNSNLNSSQTSGILINVNASNVTLDFQGHYIAGAVGNTNQSTTGVNANEQSNLTIKNGTIAFCSTGVSIGGNGSATTNSVGHQVDNLRVTYCYFIGVHISSSPASRITNCQVSQTGSAGTTSAAGIDVGGAGVTVQGNVVSNVTASGSAYGVYANTGCFVRQNTISNASYGVVGGKYQDNLTANCTTPFLNGTDAGGNN